MRRGHGRVYAYDIRLNPNLSKEAFLFSQSEGNKLGVELRNADGDLVRRAGRSVQNEKCEQSQNNLHHGKPPAL